MRTTATLALAVGATLAIAPAASADRRSLCDLAAPVRHDVIKKHGKRAPGRHICRDGVRARGKVRKPTNHEKAEYLRALRRLRNPLPLLTRAGPPPLPPAATASPRAGGTLSAIAACESGGNYSTNTGNGFYGAYQFDLQTWQSVGGSGLPSSASPAEQDKRAAILHSQRGSAPWPVCGQ